MNPTTISAPEGQPVIEITRDFAATPAQLFRLYTDRDLVAQWLGPRELEMEIDTFDVRPGGGYRYIHRSADGAEYAFRGVFHSVVPNEQIIQTFEYEGAPGEVCLESASYEAIEGGVRLHTRSVYLSLEARDAMVATGMEHGVVDSFNRADELLAGGL
jgi:uncharacterized protein YndB with AHSA1/START domain